MVGETDVNNCIVSELNNQKKKYKSRSKIVSKFGEKLLDTG